MTPAEIERHGRETLAKSKKRMTGLERLELAQHIVGLVFWLALCLALVLSLIYRLT